MKGLKRKTVGRGPPVKSAVLSALALTRIISAIFGLIGIFRFIHILQTPCLHIMTLNAFKGLLPCKIGEEMEHFSRTTIYSWRAPLSQHRSYDVTAQALMKRIKIYIAYLTFKVYEI
jgi:hypothetical protein